MTNGSGISNVVENLKAHYPELNFADGRLLNNYKMIYAVPWTTPPLLIAWLGSGGSIGAVITQALCVVLSFIVYLPFVFAANKQEN